MLATLWGVLFVASGMLIALMLLLIRPFLLAPKTFPTFIFFSGLALQIIGVSGNTIAMAKLPVTSTLLKEVPNFFILVPVIFPISFFLGFALNPIYLIANRKKPSKSDLVLSFFPVLIGFVLLVIFKMTHRHFLGLDGQDQRTAVVLFASIFSLYVSLWLQFQLNQILKIIEYWGPVLKLVSNINIASILFGVADLIFLIVNFYTDYFLSNQFGSLPSYELFAKTIKLTFMILIEVMLCLHWLQFFSHTAIQEREGKRRIQELLVEKEALIQSLINKQALAETGALAAGLTHELNQYLARIQLNNEEVLHHSQQLAMKEIIEPSLNRISQATRSASSLILSIKKLFKKDEQDIAPSDPNILIQDVIMVFKTRLHHSAIQLEYQLDCNRNVELWDTLFRQVISNLILNAIEALEGSDQGFKKITIRTDEKEADFICCIADNGPGFAQHILEEGVNLFKTTKSTGTGLGLWLSQYIVEHLHGSLIVEQSQQGGAQITIRIPFVHPTIEGL